uniref:G-protein coupled receptors family 1 profile domain-containing protein n=1 Tax=Spermophilus dauricus TaxID=99837 RepID=A0A8C9QIR1_SPEDA
MGHENQTREIQFHFHPFSPILEVQMFIFVLFLLLYIGSLLGNATISLTVWAERSLHIPMYFFLANLAVLEIFYSSTVAPLALVNLVTMGRIPISFAGCGTQMFFFVFLGSADCILLGIMAYDRFVAIREPLRYTLIMRRQLCAQLALGALVLGFILALQLTVLIFHLPFCGHNRITHFYCDVLPILRLACGDTRMQEAMIFIVSVIILTIPFSLISISYVFIIAAILKIRSVEGRNKAFSTCSSHLTVVLLQYGCCSLIYLRPSSSYNPEMGRVVSVVYTFVTPVLNPLIYSMRNKELKDALNKVVRSARTFPPVPLTSLQFSFSKDIAPSSTFSPSIATPQKTPQLLLSPFFFPVQNPLIYIIRNQEVTNTVETCGKNFLGGWGCGSSGNMLAWHVRAAEFDPQHHIKNKIKMLCPPKTEK